MSDKKEYSWAKYKPSGFLKAFIVGLFDWWSCIFQEGYRRSLMSFLSDQFSAFEDQDRPVCNVYMNAKTYRKLRCTLPESFDPVTRKELLRNGYMGDFWNAGIRVDKGLKDNEFVFSAEEVKTAGEGDELRILSFTEWPEDAPTGDCEIKHRNDDAN